MAIRTDVGEASSFVGRHPDRAGCEISMALTAPLCLSTSELLFANRQTRVGGYICSDT